MAHAEAKYSLSGKLLYYQICFTDRYGKRKRRKGFLSKTETVKKAYEVESRERLIRDGYMEAPTIIREERDIDKIITEYIAWGRAQGGRNGYPWNKVHASKKQSCLDMWKEALKLKVADDMLDTFSKVEAVLREFQSTGFSGKTVCMKLAVLTSFARWCVKRKILKSFPFDGLEGPNDDPSPENERRLITHEELSKILAVSPPEYQLLFKCAWYSGFRANELRHLQLMNLNENDGTLMLEAEYCKSRKNTIQIIPWSLVKELVEFGKAQTAKRLYNLRWRSHYGPWQNTRPANPLLYVPMDTAQSLDRFRVKTDIPKFIPGEGKLDFHCFRKAYITYIDEEGGTVKQVQTLARHSTPTLTYGTYASARDSRLRDLVERMEKTTIDILKSYE